MIRWLIKLGWWLTGGLAVVIVVGIAILSFWPSSTRPSDHVGTTTTAPININSAGYCAGLVGQAAADCADAQASNYDQLLQNYEDCLNTAPAAYIGMCKKP